LDLGHGAVRSSHPYHADHGARRRPTAGTLDRRRGAVLTLVLVAFAALVVGVLRLDWGFNEMAALFFAMGVVAGLVGGWASAARRTRSSPDSGPWPTPRCSSVSRGRSSSPSRKGASWNTIVHGCSRRSPSCRSRSPRSG